MKKLIKTFIYTTAVLLFLSFTLSLIVILILINKGLFFDETNINIFNTILRASFVFIGSFLSGSVAILIFILNYIKDNKLKEDQAHRYLNKIKYEYKNNIAAVQDIYEAFSSVASEDIASLLFKEEQDLKERILIHFTRLDFSLYDSLVKEISQDDYIENSDNWNRLIRVYKYLNLLLSSVKSTQNAIILIDGIKEEAKHLVN